ncbi:hypothetical protein L6452_22210 [Arctium lappa]|uniref:Uncharacterized protein n=1 Tax=Arctium lappa TaxID=4217 RepID=A0ACB9AYB0_ARCLA|nr:hypothetical protein L6452_22210 [Arctium lappa]
MILLLKSIQGIFVILAFCIFHINYLPEKKTLFNIFNVSTIILLKTVPFFICMCHKFILLFLEEFIYLFDILYFCFNIM